MNVKRILTKNAMIIVTIMVIVFFSITTGGKMLFPQNVNNLISQNAYVFILATGMLLCILTGGNIDLSVGSIVCLIGAIGAVLMVNRDWPIWASMLAMLLSGLAIGAWQGYWIAFKRIPPFIVTLAGMLIWRGLANVILQGLTISPMPDGFSALFNSYIPDIFGNSTFNITCFLVAIILSVFICLYSIYNRTNKIRKHYEVEPVQYMAIKLILICAVLLAFMFKLAQYKGIPVILIWVSAVVALYSYVTSKTTTGRYFYAVGGNEKATALSGINTNRVYFMAYVNMALLSSVAAWVVMARLNSANPTAGTNYELDAIGSCFIGGASAYGGVGTTGGVVVGAILMGILNLGMSIMGVDMNWQKVVKGFVLLFAVIFDVLSKEKATVA